MGLLYAQQGLGGPLNGSVSAPMDSGEANGLAGYAGSSTNAMLSYGLNLSRENIVDPIQTARVLGVPATAFAPANAWTAADRLPPPDVDAYLSRWEPASRFYLLLTEMVSGLEFSSSGTTFTVHCREPGGALKPVLSMTRPSRDIFDQQLNKVFARANERNDRTAEILTQLKPQVAYWSAICNLHPNRTSWTLELADAVLHFSMLVCQRIKHALACPRPVEYSPLVQPIVMTPGFATFPMGHATEAYMFSAMMKNILGRVSNSLALKATGEQLDLVARRISDNRVIAGLHFPIDAPAGFVLADALGDYLNARLVVGGSAQGRVFEGDKVPGNWDADPQVTYDGKTPFASLGTSYTPSHSPMLAYMFSRAKDELVYPPAPPAAASGVGK